MVHTSVKITIGSNLKLGLNDYVTGLSECLINSVYCQRLIMHRINRVHFHPKFTKNKRIVLKWLKLVRKFFPFFSALKFEIFVLKKIAAASFIYWQLVTSKLLMCLIGSILVKWLGRIFKIVKNDRFSKIATI